MQCGAGFLTPPFLETKWKVAQILTLFMEAPTTVATETSATASTASSCKYFCHVRWMAHVSNEGEQLLTPKELKNIIKQLRPDQMLLETGDIQKVPLTSILTASICLEEYKEFGDKNQVPPERIEDGYWKVFFYCNRRIDAAGVVLRASDDWIHYCQQVRPTTAGARTVMTRTNPPAALSRGWDDLQQQALSKVVVSGDNWTDEHLKQLTAALVQGYTQAAVANLQQQATLPDRFQVLDNEEEDETVETKNDEATDRDNKENARRNDRSKGRKQPPRTPTSSKLATKTTTTKTTPRPTKRASTKKATLSKKAAPPITKKRPPSKEAASTRGKTKSNKKRRVSHDNSVSDSVAGHAGESDQESDPSIVPTSKAVYIPKPLKTTKTNPKKKNAVVVEDPPFRFYEGVELDVDPSRCDQKVRSSGLASRWQVQVGDVIAVGCVESSKPLKSPVDGGRKLWYPFTVPWSPAQVLAVYHNGDDYFMELRWMYRPADLEEEVLENMPQDIHKDLFEDDQLSRRMIVEIDEDVIESPIGAALGRIVTTSDSNPSISWLDTFKSKDGVPQIPLICKYFGELNDGPIKRIQDWTDYGESSASAGPLGRGILCPKSLLEKDPKLRKFYEKIVRGLYGLDGEFKALADYAPPPTPDRKSVISWPADVLDDAIVRVPLDAENVLHKDIGPAGMCREFFKSVQVPVVAKRCDSRATAKKSTTSNNLWNLQVGDVVCLANNKANKAVHQSSTRNPWYPYVGPWGFCQVLAIYRDAIDDVSLSPQPLLEVRHFYRLTDLPIHVKSWMARSDDSEKEEVYETEVVESGIPASRVLGRVDLFLGLFEEIANMKADSNDDATPVASCRCRYFYDASFERLQPIFCARTRPAEWFRRMLERGFKASKSINDHAELGAGIEFSLGIGLGSPNNVRIEDLCRDMMQTDSKPVGKTLFVHEQESDQRREYLLSSSLQPPWTFYAQHDSICSEKDRKDLWWNVKVGDVVAVRADEHSASHNHEWYPFNRPWRPCQILAMYQEKGSTTDKGRWLVQVRWFIRRRELPNTPEPSLLVPGLERLYETDDLSSEPLDNSMLLGPIALFSNSGVEASAAVWKAVDPFLPVAPFVYSGLYVNDMQHHGGIPSDPSKMLHPIIKRGIEMSSHYSDKEKETVLAALDVHDVQCEVSEASDNTGAWTTIPPFHVDHATKREYYTEFCMHPPYSEYGTDPQVPQTETLPIWTVRLGDAVIIRYGNNSFGKALYPHPKDKGGKNFPMKNAWAIGEVVTIMKVSDSTDPSGMHQLDDPSTGEDPENFSLEIRWFYRLGELPGSKRDTNNRNRTGDECEEIFETDLYGKLSPSSLLSPAVLHPTGRSIRAGIVQLGMPVLEFCCSQYYSVHGQSNLACGGLDGRVERGRVKSSYFGKDAALKKALDRIRSTGPTMALGSTHSISASWKEAFNRVIKKLALTDASKEAYENRSALIGREDEKQEILSFLEAAISGDSTDNKASIFIAGPPGTGKQGPPGRLCLSLVDTTLGFASILPLSLITYLSGLYLSHLYDLLLVFTIAQEKLPVSAPRYVSFKTLSREGRFQTLTSYPSMAWKCAIHSKRTADCGKSLVAKTKRRNVLQRLQPQNSRLYSQTGAVIPRKRAVSQLYSWTKSTI